MENNRNEGKKKAFKRPSSTGAMKREIVIEKVI